MGSTPTGPIVGGNWRSLESSSLLESEERKFKSCIPDCKRRRKMKITDLIKKHREVGLKNDPEFDKARRYDWRLYIPDEMRTVWKEMTVESRITAYIVAEAAAQQAMSSSRD